MPQVRWWQSRNGHLLHCYHCCHLTECYCVDTENRGTNSTLHCHHYWHHTECYKYGSGSRRKHSLPHRRHYCHQGRCHPSECCSYDSDVHGTYSLSLVINAVIRANVFYFLCEKLLQCLVFTIQLSLKNYAEINM